MLAVLAVLAVLVVLVVLVAARNRFAVGRPADHPKQSVLRTRVAHVFGDVCGKFPKPDH